MSNKTKCSCTHEAGDSDCAAHPTCPDCGADIDDTRLTAERDALAAKLDAVWSSLADDIGMTEDDDETEVRKEIKRLHDLVSHLTDLTVGMEAERDEARMLMRDAQIQAEDRGRSYAAAIARAEQAERKLATNVAEFHRVYPLAVQRAEQAERELERWRHGATIEGDFVCPNELRAINAETELRTLRAAMPTAEEREALVELASEVRSLFRGQPQAELAVAAIDKLTKEKP